MALEQGASTAAHWSVAQYRAAFSAAQVILVGEEDQVQGFLIAREVPPEWEIENVVVAARARRLGLGGRLVDEFLRIALHRGARSFFLEVRESNLAARRLYEKKGFAASGRRKQYYCEPAEDAITYSLGIGRSAP